MAENTKCLHMTSEQDGILDITGFIWQNRKHTWTW